MLFTAGCASQKHFYNLRYPQTTQQTSYNSDIRYCNAVAYGMAPMPPVNLQPTGPTHTSGTLIGNNGYVGSYADTTYQDTSMATMSNLLNLSSALAAQNARRDISSACMTRIGWFEVDTNYKPPEENLTQHESPASIDALIKKSYDLTISGDYEGALTVANAALSIAETRFGAQGFDTGLALSNIALIYTKQKRPGLAEPYFKKSLVIFEKTFGADSPATAERLTILARIYEDQFKFKEAAELYGRANSIFFKNFGPEDNKTKDMLAKKQFAQQLQKLKEQDLADDGKLNGLPRQGQ